MLKEFDSLSDFARLASNYPQAFQDKAAGCTFKQAIKLGIEGDTSCVDRANKMLSEIDGQLPETLSFTRKHSPYCGTVNIGDWLAGSPTPMRRRVRVASEINPLKVIVGVSCSAGISSQLMEQRGVTILALVFRLQKIRPVELFLLTEDKSRSLIEPWHYNLIKIESTPFAIGQACFGLCSDSIERHLSYTVLPSFDAHPAWPEGYNTQEYWNLKRTRLGVTDQDLLIRSAHLHDPLINQPVQWIKDQLEKHGSPEEN